MRDHLEHYDYRMSKKSIKDQPVRKALAFSPP